MKANLTNLKKVLRICAKAHKCEFNDWSNEGQLGLHSETPATICDVQFILDAFYGRHDMVENSYGFVTVWLEPMMYGNKSQVDVQLCALGLPYGTDLSNLS